MINTLQDNASSYNFQSRSPFSSERILAGAAGRLFSVEQRHSSIVGARKGTTLKNKIKKNLARCVFIKYKITKNDFAMPGYFFYVRVKTIQSPLV